MVRCWLYSFVASQVWCGFAAYGLGYRARKGVGMNKDGIEAVVKLIDGTVCFLNYVPELGEHVDGWIHDENGKCVDAQGIVLEILELV